jgi:hypothetical protein
MPYEIKQDGDNYQVIDKDNDDIVATHEPPDAKEKAERQVELLHQVESHENWDKNDG